MKKILIVTSVASMIDQFLLPQVEEYIKKDWNVVVATNFDEPGTITKEKSEQLQLKLQEWTVVIKQIDFARSPLNKKNFQAYKQIKQCMNEECFDIIHSHSPIGGLVTRLVTAKHKKQKGAKIVYTAHGFHFYEGAPKKNWIIYYPIEKWMARYTDALITINYQDYQIAKENFKTRSANGIFKVNGVGIDLDEYQASEMKDGAFKEHLGIPKDNFVVTMIGELNQNKNQLQMIEAIEKINNKAITLILVGTGPNYELFKKQYADNEQIKVLGYRTDIKQLLNITDVVASMSYREGLPKNVMEAMAAAKPVIATNIRGNQDLVVDGVTGYLVAVNDSTATAQAIEKVQADTENKLGKQGRIRIQEYRIKKVLAEVGDIYGKQELCQ